MTNENADSFHPAPGKPAGRDDWIIARRHRLVTALAPPHGRVLLDFGCGNGAQTFLFTPDFPLIVGADIGGGHLAQLRDEAERLGLSSRMLPVRFDGKHLPLPDASVDYAVSFEVLEHVAHEKEALDELARVIRPGGTLSLSVPNRWWLFETHGANLPILPWNRVPFFSWLPKRVHDRHARARIYTRREIAGKLNEAGFNVLHALYITAPMDVVKWRPLRHLLRGTAFRSDRTNIPFLATAILSIAIREA